MRRALELAAGGRGRVEPNPMVGAVIVRDDKIVGEGFHERFGAPHAEPNAIAAAGEACLGATLYITLEPCTAPSRSRKSAGAFDCGLRNGESGMGNRVVPPASSLQPKASGLASTRNLPFDLAHGPEPVEGQSEIRSQKKKTPPCCDAVIRAGLRQVVIGARDVTQEAAVPRLEAAGIEVVTGVLEEDCKALIAPFLKLRLERRPYVIAKWAMPADGKIGTVTGDSQWVSSEEARNLVHTWRGEMNAVLVGAGTVRKDDPLLTCRIPGGRNPFRIVLDSQATLALSSKLAQTVCEAPLLVACHESAPEAHRHRLADAGCRVLPLQGEGRRPDPAALLDVLGAEEMTYLMIEGGGEVLAAFFEERLIDEVRIFIAPKLAGGTSAPTPIGGKGIASMADALRLERVTWTPIAEDMLLTGRIARD